MRDRRVATIVWRGKCVIALSLVLSLALAAFVTERSQTEYVASAILQVDLFGAGSTTASTDPYQQLRANQTQATTDAELIEDQSFLDKIRPRVAHGLYTVGYLLAHVSASPITNTALIKISTTGDTPESAKLLAQDVATAFLASFEHDTGVRANGQQAQIRSQIADLSSQLKGLSESSDPGDKERAASLQLASSALTRQLARLVASSIAEGSSVSLAAPATASPSAVKPKPVLNMLAGVMLGLVLGVFLAWLRERLDRGLHDAQEVEALVEAPVLAAVPLRKKYSPDDPAVNEAHDVLRANIAFIGLDQALHVITFTSYNPAEGKTSTVEGLAYAAIQSGTDVLVIDGDARTQSLSTRFGAHALPGLTSIVAGASSLDEAVLEVEPGLSLLPAGPVPPSPPSLLASGWMRELVTELRDRYPLILIDSPPVAHLADAALLASVSDGVVMVARVAITNRADRPQAVANLRQSPAPIVGVVLLRPQTVDGSSYYAGVTDGREELSDSLLEV